MNLLLAAATVQEVHPFLDGLKNGRFQGHEIDVLITGPGLMAATYSLSRQIAIKKPDLVIQAGIAGCFNRRMPLGAVVAIKQDRVADEGVVENEQFRNLFDLNLVKADRFPYNKQWLLNPFASFFAKKYGLVLVNAISINEISTDPARIKEYKTRYKPQVESMEGAALHYVCLHEKTPFMQLRGISNYVGERNKAKWNFQKPIENLNKAIIAMLAK